MCKIIFLLTKVQKLFLKKSNEYFHSYDHRCTATFFMNHSVHASLGPPESKSRAASRSLQPFLHSSRQSVCTFSPQNCPFPWGIWTPWFISSPERKRYLDRFSRVCRGHYSVTDRPTDRPRYSVCNIRPHLANAAYMRPNNNRKYND